MGKKKKADVSAKELAADMVVGGLLAVLSPVPAMTYAAIRAADYEKRLGRRRKGKEIVLATGSISIFIHLQPLRAHCGRPQAEKAPSRHERAQSDLHSSLTC